MITLNWLKPSQVRRPIISGDWRSNMIAISLQALLRDGPLAYNVAVLIGPFGEVVGKYRKVTLPREEIAKGIAPGDEYPVFQTRFGTIGMMVCYDVFFPEVARNLAMKGAEVIALPIWGGNPRLAAARCAENGVYLVTSTYTDHEANWMKTAISFHRKISLNT